MITSKKLSTAVSATLWNVEVLQWEMVFKVTILDSEALESWIFYLVLYAVSFSVLSVYW